MFRLLAALLILAVSSTQTFAQTAVLVACSATIESTKSCGCPWDFPLVGKKAAPDPYIKVWVYERGGAQVDYGETFVEWDTTEPTWNKDIAQVKDGQVIWVEVWDKDAKYDDLIGRYNFTLSKRTMDKGTFYLKFDQVTQIAFSVRMDAKPATQARVTLMQPYPGPNGADKLERTKDRSRAVILLGGLDLRDDGASAATPRFVDWQGSTSTLVKGLSRHADVYSIAYAQNTAVEEIASFPELREAVGNVKKLGYSEVVLLGHSAGGILARHFVEEHPRAGVTRVIQVAAPNSGTKLAGWAVRLLQVPPEQASFVASLSPAHRAAVLKGRENKMIPTGIDFVSVVSCTSPKDRGDGAVNRQCQWPPDLQQQGVPCACVQASHAHVMYQEDCCDLYCKLITESQPRWGHTQV